MPYLYSAQRWVDLVDEHQRGGLELRNAVEKATTSVYEPAYSYEHLATIYRLEFHTVRMLVMWAL
jgi:hypothetical protein